METTDHELSPGREDSSDGYDHDRRGSGSGRCLSSGVGRDRRKLDLLLNLRLRDVTRTGESLHDVMVEITRNARSRGLTPEILEELLRD